MDWRKLIKLVAVMVMCALTVCATCATVSAQTYSTEYPDIFNSGSPLWIQCTVRDYGEYVILLDPNINLQSFGFDSFKGYNLINNTGSTIYGRAYSTTDSSGYMVRFQSYYCMQFGIPGSNVSSTWTDVYITDITGTTLDLIDYHGSRGSDTLTREEEVLGHEAAQTIILAVIGLCMLMRGWFKFTYRQRGKQSVSVQS